MRCEPFDDTWFFSFFFVTNPEKNQGDVSLITIWIGWCPPKRLEVKLQEEHHIVIDLLSTFRNFAHLFALWVMEAKHLIRQKSSRFFIFFGNMDHPSSVPMKIDSGSQNAPTWGICRSNRGQHMILQTPAEPDGFIVAGFPIFPVFPHFNRTEHVALISVANQPGAPVLLQLCDMKEMPPLQCAPKIFGVSGFCGTWLQHWYSERFPYP